MNRKPLWEDVLELIFGLLLLAYCCAVFTNLIR